MKDKTFNIVEEFDKHSFIYSIVFFIIIPLLAYIGLQGWQAITGLDKIFFSCITYAFFVLWSIVLIWLFLAIVKQLFDEQNFTSSLFKWIKNVEYIYDFLMLLIAFLTSAAILFFNYRNLPTLINKISVFYKR